MGMERKAALAAALWIIAGGAQASCKELAAAIDDSEKDMAMAYAESVGDNSAPRATLRQMRTSTALSVIQINLQLMAAQKCPLPAGPINDSGGAYVVPATECALASRIEEKPKSCDRSTWKHR
jgi:hypothetical protein